MAVPGTPEQAHASGPFARHRREGAAYLPVSRSESPRKRARIAARAWPRDVTATARLEVEGRTNRPLGRYRRTQEAGTHFLGRLLVLPDNLRRFDRDGPTR